MKGRRSEERKGVRGRVKGRRSPWLRVAFEEVVGSEMDYANEWMLGGRSGFGYDPLQKGEEAES